MFLPRVSVWWNHRNPPFSPQNPRSVHLFSFSVRIHSGTGKNRFYPCALLSRFVFGFCLDKRKPQNRPCDCSNGDSDAQNQILMESIRILGRRIFAYRLDSRVLRVVLFDDEKFIHKETALSGEFFPMMVNFFDVVSRRSCTRLCDGDRKALMGSAVDELL